MNLDVDPCEDFYEFACGSYRKRAIRVGVGSFDEIRRITYGQLKSIITGGSSSDFPPLEMAYNFYRSCISDGWCYIYLTLGHIVGIVFFHVLWHFSNVTNLKFLHFSDTAKTVGVRPIYEKLSQLGKWPLTEVNKSTSWLEVMRKTRNLGFFPDYMVSITVLINPRNNSEILIAVRFIG